MSTAKQTSSGSRGPRTRTGTRDTTEGAEPVTMPAPVSMVESVGVQQKLLTNWLLRRLLRLARIATVALVLLTLLALVSLLVVLTI